MPVPELSATAVLDLWQAAERWRPVERALALAAAAGEGPGAEELAALPVGRRDARILALHAALGGEELEATACCPGCGEQAEFTVDVEALLATVRDAPPPAAVEANGLVVVWRPPDSRDLAAAASAGDATAAERVLLGRCVTSVTGPDGEQDATRLPAPARAAVARAMAEADPLAEVLADAACPACGVEFVADLDVAGFVWAELRTHARRLLREVDTLARAYGWTEAEVLSLDERRRAAYLELAQGGRP
jgi:hypothetical protein